MVPISFLYDCLELLLALIEAGLSRPLVSCQHRELLFELAEDEPNGGEVGFQLTLLQLQPDQFCRKYFHQ